MQWLLIAVAVFMFIALFSIYLRRRQVGDLLRALAWVSFTVFLFNRNNFFLYVAIGLFVVGMFFRSRYRKDAPAVEESEEEEKEPEEEDEFGEEYSDKYYVAPPPPLPCEPVDREVEAPLVLDMPVTYPTADDRTLVIDAGTHIVRVRLCVLFKDLGASDFPIDSLAITHQLADAGGQVWETEVPANTYLIGDPFEELLERMYHEEDASVVLHREETAPPAWRAALTEQCLLAGLQGLNDSRGIYEVIIDGQKLWIQFKYQMPVYDIAWLADERVFLIRVTNLCDYRRIIHPDGDGSEKLPPIYFTLQPSELLLRSTEWYDDEDGERYEFGEDGEYEIRFQPTGQSATPDSGVRVNR